MRRVFTRLNFHSNCSLTKGHNLNKSFPTGKGWCHQPKLTSSETDTLCSQILGTLWHPNINCRVYNNQPCPTPDESSLNSSKLFLSKAHFSFTFPIYAEALTYYLSFNIYSGKFYVLCFSPLPATSVSSILLCSS